MTKLNLKTFARQRKLSTKKPSEWEKISANDITDKGLISKSYKEIIQFNIKEANNLVFKNEQKIGIDIFPKKTYRFPKGT